MANGNQKRKNFPSLMMLVVVFCSLMEAVFMLLLMGCWRGDGWWWGWEESIYETRKRKYGKVFALTITHFGIRSFMNELINKRQTNSTQTFLSCVTVKLKIDKMWDVQAKTNLPMQSIKLRAGTPVRQNLRPLPSFHHLTSNKKFIRYDWLCRLDWFCMFAIPPATKKHSRMKM